jgi:hypothetical protein
MAENEENYIIKLVLATTLIVIKISIKYPC